MEYDFKREARKQYLRYFRLWFIAVAVLAAICAVLGAVRFLESRKGRANNEAPAERVYDYADVLTDAEEEQLRRYIAEKEKALRIDIVLVTISQPVQGAAAKEQYGYRSVQWEDNMQDIADDFWDDNRYGYNKGFNGDGILLLHNWYEGQNGEQLATSGKVEKNLSIHDLHAILYAVDDYYETDPFRAYLAYVDAVEGLLNRSSVHSLAGGLGIIVPLITAVIYAAVHLVQKQAQNTTAVNAYVQGGKPEMNRRSDDLLRKTVATRRIQTSSGSGGSSGRSSGGGGGHHVSRSGASHGGASHRH